MLKQEKSILNRQVRGFCRLLRIQTDSVPSLLRIDERQDRTDGAVRVGQFLHWDQIQQLSFRFIDKVHRVMSTNKYVY